MNPGDKGSIFHIALETAVREYFLLLVQYDYIQGCHYPGAQESISLDAIRRKGDLGRCLLMKQ